MVFFMTAFFGLIGGLFAWYVVPPPEFTMLLDGKLIPVFSNWARIAITLSSAVICGFLSLVCTDYIKSVRRHKKEKTEFLSIVNSIHNRVDNIDKKLEEKLVNLIEYAAFHTEGEKLENAVKLLRKTRGKKVWIIAKFISKQLSDSIFPHKIEMNGYHYSEFAENLYPECEKSIFLTSLFTPKEWFDELYPIKKVEQIGEGKSLSKDEIPHHVNALSVFVKQVVA